MQTQNLDENSNMLATLLILAVNRNKNEKFSFI